MSAREADLERCLEEAALYKARVESIYENVMLKEDWAARISAEGRRVRDAIAAKDGRWAKEYEFAARLSPFLGP